MKWEAQNGHTTKNGVLSVTNLFFWKFCFIIKTQFKDLIWCTNYHNVHIHTFCKRWSFVWGCFLPVSILKVRFSKKGFCLNVVKKVKVYHKLKHKNSCNYSFFRAWFEKGNSWRIIIMSNLLILLIDDYFIDFVDCWLLFCYHEFLHSHF